ncbi:hypothetical protein BXZ70DRAFT_910862 [Cristinia sonorae]|uniref:Uncharacterized protein n=1 Tax=Cristinia sonorae TaxID=1940300 RepID=A0A8K0UFK4_9AGAR|nr:hypothetical protein BXZ70DRAFT_910862 [Cristinia sonorae]
MVAAKTVKIERSIDAIVPSTRVPKLESAKHENRQVQQRKAAIEGRQLTSRLYQARGPLDSQTTDSQFTRALHDEKVLYIKKGIGVPRSVNHPNSDDDTVDLTLPPATTPPALLANTNCLNTPNCTRDIEGCQSGPVVRQTASNHEGTAAHTGTETETYYPMEVTASERELVLRLREAVDRRTHHWHSVVQDMFSELTDV